MTMMHTKTYEFECGSYGYCNPEKGGDFYFYGCDGSQDLSGSQYADRKTCPICLALRTEDEK